MDSDLDVGRHCKQCNLKDFLPIACQYCRQDFCRSHVLEHSCSSRPEADAQYAATSSANAAGKSYASCSFCAQRSIVACPDCDRLVCPAHRFHSGCVSSSTPASTLALAPTQNAQARALLAKYFPAKANTKPPIAVSATAGSETPLVERIKMKRSAVPLLAAKDATTPVWERVHFRVVFGSQDKIFWCPKTMIIGRAVDLIAQSFRVTISDTAPAYLASLLVGELLPNGGIMSQAVKDGETVKLVSVPEK